VKPWSGVIPDDDLAVFAAGHLPEDRPITAGERPALMVVDLTLERPAGLPQREVATV
jgi:maleamate amidohydrolase